MRENQRDQEGNIISRVMNLVSGFVIQRIRIVSEFRIRVIQLRFNSYIGSSNSEFQYGQLI